MKFLDGYKSYLAGAMSIILSAFLYSRGDMENSFEMFVLGLGVIGLRSKLQNMSTKK